MYESEHEHREQVSRLNEQLAMLKSEAAQHDSVLSSLKTETSEKISRLQEEKTMLEVCPCVLLDFMKFRDGKRIW